MSKRLFAVFLILIALFLIACEQKTPYPTGYAAYQGQGAPQQQQYVGGGCGVAPAEGIENTPVSGILSAGSAA